MPTIGHVDTADTPNKINVMLENVEKNLYQWDKKHPWSKDGDEWNGQAKVCNVPYEDWKASLIAHLITPFLSPDANLLEIAPGHGRWTEHLLSNFKHLTVVDISANCLDFCRNRFQNYSGIDYFLSTGSNFPKYMDDTIDFVWSFDSFVHMDRQVISGYLGEMKRVLKVGGTVTLHHGNVDDVDQHIQSEHKGWRSAMNAELMAKLAQDAGLEVLSQFVYWDEDRKLGVPRFGDRITRLIRKN